MKYTDFKDGELKPLLRIKDGPTNYLNKYFIEYERHEYILYFVVYVVDSWESYSGNPFDLSFSFKGNILHDGRMLIEDAFLDLDGPDDLLMHIECLKRLYKFGDKLVVQEKGNITVEILE